MNSITPIGRLAPDIDSADGGGGSTVTDSGFDAASVAPILARWWTLAGRTGTPPTITDLDDFRSAVSPMSGPDYARIALAAYAGRGTNAVYVGGSSGTTGKSKLVLSRIPARGVGASEQEVALIRTLRQRGHAGPGDVFANLFMVGHFSILHHGINKMLEACQSTIVPVGTLPAEAPWVQVDFLRGCGVNALAGTPSSIVQLANVLRMTGRHLPIRRILYTGEGFGAAKRALVASVFPEARIVGLYGLSETGFMGIETATAGVYEVQRGAYFLETDAQDRLLVTGLDATQTVPILRYATGDRTLLTQVGDTVLLRGVERTGRDFNFMGNLIGLSCVQGSIARTSGLAEPEIEIRLTTDGIGRDILTVTLFGDANDSAACARMRDGLLLIPELREAIDKDAGDVLVECRPPEQFTLTPRQKQKIIIDDRT